MIGAIGLCTNCAHRKTVVVPDRALYILCEHPGLPKYPSLPVYECTGFKLKEKTNA